MDISLKYVSVNEVEVTCDGQSSHSFDIHSLQLGEWDDEKQAYILTDPKPLGESLYQALFPDGSAAYQALQANPSRIVIVSNDTLDAIPWEFLYGPNGYLGLDFPLLRGIPVEERIAPPDLKNVPLHIAAVPSNPIDNPRPLDIEGEWVNLTEAVRSVEYELTLDRVFPPTMSQLRRVVAGKSNRVVHFMGHGRQLEDGAVVEFEDRIGEGKQVTALDFIRRVKKYTFLVTLNACETAMAGRRQGRQYTEFANMAKALVEHGIPYALGMQYAVPDSDAKAFSRALYDELARGIPVEQAVVQVRNELADLDNPFAVGISVLYTSLHQPAAGFSHKGGVPQVHDNKPEMDVLALPRAEGAFQGRKAELLALGEKLTGSDRPKLFTIHGGGGQGKTALAREAVERFAHAWPGGVWAISLENLPTRLEFVTSLASFLKVPTDDLPEATELERRVLNALGQRRTLLVLDNAETMVEAVERQDAEAIDLVAFIRGQISGTLASLLVTSRYILGWIGEDGFSLGGLTPAEGAALFLQSALQRSRDVSRKEAEDLSQRLAGHPLALRLLGSAFNQAPSVSIDQLAEEYETYLAIARDKYREESDRRHSIYASIETSVRHLDGKLRSLLSGLWIFEAPFLPEIAAAVFASLDVEGEADVETRRKQIIDQLHVLQQRGLLVGEQRTFRDGNILTYRLLPTMRPYVRDELKQVYPKEELRTRFGAAYAGWVQTIYRELDRGGASVWLAGVARTDIDRGLDHTHGEALGWYQNRWGWVLGRLGDRRRAISLLEAAKELAEGKYPELELDVINNLAGMYHATGQLGWALKLYEQALPIRREDGDRVWIAKTLNNMAGVYRATGQPGKALELYEEALPIRREVGDRSGEARTLNNIAGVYYVSGQPETALELFEQALEIMQEMGDRVGEAAILTSVGEVYHSIGHLEKALELFQVALPIRQEVEHRAGVAVTLNNMAGVYGDIGQPRKALELFEQALSVMREVGDKFGEAATLNNMGEMYRFTGQLRKALTIFEKALLIMREVGDRIGEATSLHNIAGVYDARGQPGKALEMLKQVLPIRREAGDRAGEAMTCFNLAMLLCDDGKDLQAIEYLRQAVSLENEVQHPDYEQDAALLAQWEAAIEREIPLREIKQQNGISPKEQQAIINNSIAVMTDLGEKKTEWHKLMAGALQQATEQDLTEDAEFFTALITLLDGETPELSTTNPYTAALEAIQKGVAEWEPGQPSAVEGLAEEDAKLMNAIRAYLDANDIPAKRQAVEEHQDALFSEKAAGFFRLIMQNAREEGQEQAAGMFEFHLGLLNECKENGIGAAFEGLEAAIRAAEEQSEGSSGEGTTLPADFVDRCVAGMLGPPKEKQDSYNYLTDMGTKHPVYAALIGRVQRAYFGEDLAALGEGLTGEGARIWHEFVERLSARNED